MEAFEEGKKCAFTGADRAGNGDTIASADGEIDVFEDWASGDPREVQSPQFDLLADGGQVACVGGAGDFQRRIKHFKDSFSTGEAGLDCIGDVGDMSDLGGEFLEQSGEHEQTCARRDFSLNNEPSTVADEYEHIELREQPHGRLKAGQSSKDGIAVIANFFCGGLKSNRLFVFAGKSFDYVDALDVFDEQSDEFVVEFTGFAIGGLNNSREDTGGDPEKWRRCEAGECKFGVNSEHPDEVDGERDSHGQNTERDLIDEGADLVGIAGCAIDKRAAVTGIVKAKGEELKAFVDIGTKADKDFLGECSGGGGDEEFEECGQECGDENGKSNGCDGEVWGPAGWRLKACRPLRGSVLVVDAPVQVVDTKPGEAERGDG